MNGIGGALKIYWRLSLRAGVNYGKPLNKCLNWELNLGTPLYHSVSTSDISTLMPQEVMYPFLCHSAMVLPLFLSAVLVFILLLLHGAISTALTLQLRMIEPSWIMNWRQCKKKGSWLSYCASECTACKDLGTSVIVGIICACTEV